MNVNSGHLLAATASSLLLMTILGALWLRERAPHLRLWAAAWAAAAGTRLVFALRSGDLGPVWLDLVLLPLYTAHGALVIEGTRSFGRASAPPRAWPWLVSLGLAKAGLLLHLLGQPGWVSSVPTAVLLAGAYAGAGITLLRRRSAPLGGSMAGGGLLLLAVHASVAMPLFAGEAAGTAFLIERVLCIVIGLGIVFVHIDEAYRRIRRADDIIANTDEGVLQLDLAGRPLEANPALARVLGFDSVDALLRADLSPLLGRAAASSTQPDEATELQWQRRDGAPVWVALQRRPHRDARGELLGFHVHVRDTTEERSLAASLQRAEKLHALGQLAGGVAHDFNNVLTVLEASLDLAREHGDDPERRRRLLDRARRAVSRGELLTRRLLDFARQRPERLESLDLYELATACEALLEQTLDPSITVAVTGDPQTFVQGERGQFERVLMNLLLNARDALTADGGRIDVYVARRGEHVVLEVRDDGPGIPPEARSRIFDPFFTTREGGTGLGLATVYGIVTGAGGTIDVATDPTGTCFVVALPAAAPPEAGPVPEVAVRRRRIVLVAAVDPVLRELAADALHEAGYGVLQARSGLEALEVARINGFVELLVTGGGLPDLSGAHLADAMQFNFPDLPVLFLSSSGAPVEPRALRGPNRSRLAEPFRTETLLAAVRRALSGTPSRPPEEAPAEAATSP